MKATNIAHKIVVKNKQFQLPEHKDEFVPIYTEASKMRAKNENGSKLSQKKVPAKNKSIIKNEKDVKHGTELRDGRGEASR